MADTRLKRTADCNRIHWTGLHSGDWAQQVHAHSTWYIQEDLHQPSLPMQQLLEGLCSLLCECIATIQRKRQQSRGVCIRFLVAIARATYLNAAVNCRHSGAFKPPARVEPCCDICAMAQSNSCMVACAICSFLIGTASSSEGETS